MKHLSNTMRSFFQDWYGCYHGARHMFIVMGQTPATTHEKVVVITTTVNQFRMALMQIVAAWSRQQRLTQDPELQGTTEVASGGWRCLCSSLSGDSCPQWAPGSAWWPPLTCGICSWCDFWWPYLSCFITVISLWLWRSVFHSNQRWPVIWSATVAHWGPWQGSWWGRSPSCMGTTWLLCCSTPQFWPAR